MSGRKMAAVRMAYLIVRRRSRLSRLSLGGADKFVTLEVINDSFHAASGFVERDFIVGSDVGCNLARRLTLFQASPNYHRGLVQLIVFLGIEVYEDSLTTVEIRSHHVFARHKIHDELSLFCSSRR